MDFEFSPEQEMLRASVRAFLADKAPISYVREVYENERSRDVVWTELAALGVIGLDLVDAAVVLEELGRALCPAPYASSAIGAWSLADVSLRAGLETGDAIGTVAVFEPDRRYEIANPSTRAVRSGDGWVLNGAKCHVGDADLASVVLVTAVDDDGVVGIYSTADANAADETSVDGSRRMGTMTLQDAPARRLEVDDVMTAIARTLDRLGVAAVVDGVGAAQRALELAVEYAQERVQFDKPIGSFQAVQHLCADMLRTVELGRAAAYYACWAIDEASPEEAHRAATLARAFAAEAFPQLGGTAIQVFGGIGFTWEHDIHLYYKRLLSQSVALGTANDYLDELARLAVD
jgi:alkylation response protein AidB-like acyl-CoA dehydrogenase